jgi:hypothetical protein
MFVAEIVELDHADLIAVSWRIVRELDQRSEELLCDKIALSRSAGAEVILLGIASAYEIDVVILVSSIRLLFAEQRESAETLFVVVERILVRPAVFVFLDRSERGFSQETD